MPPAVNQGLLADIITSACALVCSKYRYIHQEEACHWLELPGLKTDGTKVNCSGPEDRLRTEASLS